MLAHCLITKNYSSTINRLATHMYWNPYGIHSISELFTVIVKAPTLNPIHPTVLMVIDQWLVILGILTFFLWTSIAGSDWCFHICMHKPHLQNITPQQQSSIHQTSPPTLSRFCQQVGKINHWQLTIIEIKVHTSP